MKKQRTSYADAYIYYLYDEPRNNLYIGSSRQNFKKRIRDHHTDLKGYLGELKTPRSYRSSFEIIIQDNYQKGILEYFPCESKNELEKRETEWILALNQKKNINIVNKITPNKNHKLTLPEIFYPLPF